MGSSNAFFERGMQSEVPTREDYVSAYNAVFTLKGSAPVAKYGRQVEYIEDLVRRMVAAPAFQPLDLAAIRALPKNQLMRLLLKAVAGHFIAGPTSLRGDVCRLLADPVSGTLELTRDGGENEVVLTVIALILLVVLAVMLYKKKQTTARV